MRASSDGHGTSVAGIIGANNVPVAAGTCTPSSSANQMTGVLGGVPGLNYGLRVRGGSALWGIFYFDQFIDTLATQGVSTINLSWGTTAPGLASYMQEHMQAHPEILFVLAAGNQGVDASLVTPANIKLPNTITIGSTAIDDSRAIFNAPFTSDWFTQCLINSPDAAICSSNYGAVVDMATPGIKILAPAAGCSGNPNSCYTLGKGTSFSAPMVTGTAAILQALGVGSPANIKLYLTASGDPIATDKLIGGRRLNVLCAVQLVLSPSLVLDDDFSEGNRDCSRWFTTVVPPGVGRVAVANQELEMTRITPAPSSYQGLATRCQVGGDFDVQVNYKLLTWPAQNSYTVRLAAQNLPQGNIGLVGVYRNSYADENYQFRSELGVAGLVHIPTSDTSGTIGLRRSGSTVSGYDSHGTIGSAPTTTDPTGFVIDFATPSPTAPPNIAIAFDNFKVNAGTVVCQ